MGFAAYFLIVFDFIRQEIGAEIYESMLKAILKGVEEDGILVVLEDSVAIALRKRCLEDLSNGGRGIRNQLEAHLVNPLSRVIFDMGIEPGNAVEVTAIELAETTRLVLELK